jgi:MoaA/NifB/PqqE/SkfB family radical SAM enzyme
VLARHSISCVPYAHSRPRDRAISSRHGGCSRPVGIMQLPLARTLAARAGWSAIPLSIGFELTHRCNLACHYCDRHTKGPREMTREQILVALAELVALGMRRISLDGGEPLTHPDVDEIVDFLVRREVEVFMNTNGILVPRRMRTVSRLAKVKISLDGPPSAHDAMRGAGSFEKAVRGAEAARSAGVATELTCVLGAHNADHVDELLDWVETRGFRIVFQPARNSLFLDSDRDGTDFVLEPERLKAALGRVEARKRRSLAVANRWSSLRHFRSFPDDAPIPCAAGWINATLDPEGNLRHCGQVSRSGPAHNVVALGVKKAFERLERRGCSQCWCARVVEENWAWGGRVDRMLPPLDEPRAARPRRRHLDVVG